MSSCRSRSPLNARRFAFFRNAAYRPAVAVLLSSAVVCLLGVWATAAQGSAVEEQQGAQLLQSLQGGKRNCQRLTPAQFELIGEYVMGRMLGSPAAHEAMNAQMRSTMGASGEAQARTFMGQRFANCASGTPPAAFGSMMGMMSGYTAANGETTGTRGGSMMRGGDTGHHGGRGGDDTVMVILIVVLLGAALGALAAWKPWRRSAAKSASDLLNERYARGEIDSEEYERRREALEGTT